LDYKVIICGDDVIYSAFMTFFVIYRIINCWQIERELNFNFILFTYIQLQLLAPATSPQLIEVGTIVYIKKDRKKTSNDNLQQNYKRYKLTIANPTGDRKQSNSVNYEFVVLCA